MRTVLRACWPLTLLLFAGTVPVWAFVALAALRGTGEAFFTPALGGLRARADQKRRRNRHPDGATCIRHWQRNR